MLAKHENTWKGTNHPLSRLVLSPLSPAATAGDGRLGRALVERF